MVGALGALHILERRGMIGLPLEPSLKPFPCVNLRGAAAFDSKSIAAVGPLRKSHPLPVPLTTNPTQQ